jgi:histidinol-phosphate aminotransferase
VGHTDLIEALHRVKDSFNSYPLDRFAQAGAIAAMQDRAYFEETRNKVIATREYLVAELQKLGFEVLPSGANFIFARHSERDGAELAVRLREYSIIVRHFRSPSRIAPFLRITIGTKNECQKLINALKEILEVSNFQTLI